MERYVEMRSPITGGKVKEVYENERQDFRGESFVVRSHYFVCLDTGEKFTHSKYPDTALDDLYAQYRNRHGIPFPDEIKAIRERYGMSYRQITAVLGFGENQYSQYEKGQVPSESNGKMIAAIKEKQVMLDMLERSKEEFDTEEYEKLCLSVKASAEKKDRDSLLSIVFGRTPKSVLSGFASFDEKKSSELVKKLICDGGCIFPSKLNKGMFYADMGFYKRHCKPITGLLYKAVTYGPVPVKYNTLYESIDGVTAQEISAHGNIGTKLTCDGYDSSVFSKEEIAFLDELCNKIKSMSVNEIVNASHKEYAWKEHKDTFDYIPYSDAFSLSFI